MPEPLKFASVPPETVMSLMVKLVEGSDSEKPILADCPAIMAPTGESTMIVGAKGSMTDWRGASERDLPLASNSVSTPFGLNKRSIEPISALSGTQKLPSRRIAPGPTALP